MINIVRAAILLGTASIVSLSAAAPATAQSLEVRRSFDIPAQPLADALLVFSRQSNVQVVTASAGLGTRKSRSVRGSFTPHAALDRLLKGSSLQWRAVGRGSVVVGPAAQAGNPLATQSGGAPVRLAGVNAPQSGGEGFQESGTAIQSKASEEEGTGEIVVTAQRRSELLRDIPQSASVLRGEGLSRSGLQSLQDLASSVPGLTVDSSGGVGQQQITLRGITTGSDVGPTVGVYVDDIPYGSGIIFSGAAQLALELGTFDVDRIEILRGPQGTLYGASAFGGVMKYILQPPSLVRSDARVQLEGSATEGGGFNHAVRAAAGVVLVPDKLAVRATFARNRSAGLVDDAVSGDENVDDSVTTVGRLSLLYSPTPDFNLRATALIQDIDRDGTSQVDYGLSTGRPVYGDLEQVRLRAEPFDQRVKLFSAGADYDFGFATLSGTAGYQTIDTIYSLDFSFYVPLLGPLLESLGSPVDAIALDGTYFTDKTTLEARLVSPSNASFEWLVGIYHTKEESENFQGLFGFNDNVPSDIDIGKFTIPVTLEETALYANGTYYFTPRLDATVGTRISRNKQTFEQFGTGLLGSSNPGGRSSDTVSTYLATVRYHLDSGILYARAASGYRPGGPNLVAFAPGTGEIIGDPIYEADTLWNYEVGAKLKPAPWLSVDASLFYIDWKNIQLFRTENGLSVVGNGDGAVSKGAEVSAAIRPAPGWSIEGSIAFTDATLSDPAPDLGGRAGERLPNVAKWASALSATYEFPLSDEVDAHVSAHWRFVGEREASFDTSPSGTQYALPSYHTFDLRGGLDMNDWNLDFYVRNVFDRRGQAAADLAAAPFGLPVALTVTQPRTFGLVVTKDF